MRREPFDSSRSFHHDYRKRSSERNLAEFAAHEVVGQESRSLECRAALGDNSGEE